jgi:hypothetical protein
MSTSAEAQAWVWRQVMPKGIPATGKFLLAAIAQETHRIDGGPYRADPGIAKLVAMTGLNESSISRLISGLVRGGFLARERGKPNERGHRSRDVYTLPVSVATSMAKPAESKVAKSKVAKRDVGNVQSRILPPMQTPTEPDAAGQSLHGVLREQVLSTSTSSNDGVLLKASATADAHPVRPEIQTLCDRLADRIAANDEDHKRPTVGKRWLDACRLLIDRDGRDPAKIAAVIDWCQGHEFWRANILSMPKLREKYDQLRKQALAEWEREQRQPRDFQAERERQVQDRIRARSVDPLSSARS